MLLTGSVIKYPKNVLAPGNFANSKQHHRCIWSVTLQVMIFDGHGRPLTLHWQTFYLGRGGEGSLIFPFLYRT